MALRGTRAEVVVVVRGFYGDYKGQQGQGTTQVCGSTARRGYSRGSGQSYKAKIGNRSTQGPTNASKALTYPGLKE